MDSKLCPQSGHCKQVRLYLKKIVMFVLKINKNYLRNNYCDRWLIGLFELCFDNKKITSLMANAIRGCYFQHKLNYRSHSITYEDRCVVNLNFTEVCWQKRAIKVVDSLTATIWTLLDQSIQTLLFRLKMLPDNNKSSRTWVQEKTLKNWSEIVEFCPPNENILLEFVFSKNFYK